VIGNINPQKCKNGGFMNRLPSPVCYHRNKNGFAEL
jgi:hypothetical protein